MTKRPAGSDDSLHPKRPKTTNSSSSSSSSSNSSSSKNPTTEPGSERHQILSPQDLHSLLAFDQNVGPVPRQSKDFQVLCSLVENEEKYLIVMQKSSLSSHFWPQLLMLPKVMRLLLSVMSSTTTCSLNSTPWKKGLPLSLGTSSKPGILRASQILIASLLR